MARVLLMKPIDQEYYIIAPNLGLGYLASLKETDIMWKYWTLDG